MSAAPALTHPHVTKLEHQGCTSPFTSRHAHATEWWDVQLDDGREVRVATILAVDIMDELRELELDAREIHRAAGELAIRDAASWGGLSDQRVTIELGWNDVCAHVPCPCR